MGDEPIARYHITIEVYGDNPRVGVWEGSSRDDGFEVSGELTFSPGHGLPSGEYTAEVIILSRNTTSAPAARDQPDGV